MVKSKNVLHSPDTLLGFYLLPLAVELFFAFRTSSIRWIFLWDFGPSWYHSIIHLLQICWHPWCQSPVWLHPKGALLYWGLVTVKAFWVKWTHCHIQDARWRLFELCDLMNYPAGSSVQMDTPCSQKDGHGQEQQHSDRLYGQVLKGPKVFQKNIPHSITPPPLANT